MKLKLSSERDIAILDVLEEVSPENVAILRAGITKLLQSGKVKIVMNLSEAKNLKIDVVREVLKLGVLTAEQKGTLVLVGQGDAIQQAVRALGAASPVKVFLNREAAMAAFSQGAAGGSQAAAAATKARLTAATGTNVDLKNQLNKLQAENTSLKEKLANRNIDEVRRLRFENGIFQQQLEAMDEQLKSMLKEPKRPFVMESVQTKIQQLETALEVFLDKEGLMPKK